MNDGSKSENQRAQSVSISAAMQFAEAVQLAGVRYLFNSESMDPMASIRPSTSTHMREDSAVHSSSDSVPITIVEFFIRASASQTI